MSVSVTASGALSREQLVAGLKAQMVELLSLESEETINEDSRLSEDLGLDSLDMVDLVTMVEERFGVKLPTSTDLTALKNVGNVVDLLHELIRKKAG